MQSEDDQEENPTRPVFFPTKTTVLVCSNLPLQPTASAAGVRTSFLLTNLAQGRNVKSVNYASSAGSKTNKRLQGEQFTKDEKSWKELGIQFHTLSPNRNKDAEEFLAKLSSESEDLLVVFDRFYNEEMFSHHVRKHCPNATLVLDMQDLHSLRLVRQDFIEREKPEGLSNLPPLDLVPSTDDPRLLRELASIHRSDLTLVCSEFEMDLLTEKYKINPEKLVLAPLFGSIPKGTTPLLPFNERRDYVFVGGFCHAPNVDAVRQLKRLWPKVRKATIENTVYEKKEGEDDVKLHVYGAHCPNQLRKELHDPGNGFLMHGYNPLSMTEVLGDKRIMLSPLRFGAGIKGKHIEAWKTGCPIVTTEIGAEGMRTTKSFESAGAQKFWGGRVAQSDDEFVDSAQTIYNCESKWNKSIESPLPVLGRFCGRKHWKIVCERLILSIRRKEENRREDLFRHILWHQSNRSTEYLSKYIELKETTKIGDYSLPTSGQPSDQSVRTA